VPRIFGGDGRKCRGSSSGFSEVPRIFVGCWIIAADLRRRQEKCRGSSGRGWGWWGLEEEGVAVFAEPVALGAPVWNALVDQVPEAGRVIHYFEVGGFVFYDVIEDVLGCHQ